MDKKKQQRQVGEKIDLDTMRENVLVEELRARHWKAQYETAYYHLKWTEIKPQYHEQLQKDKDEYQEQMLRFQEEIMKMRQEDLEKEEKGPTPQPDVHMVGDLV